MQLFVRMSMQKSEREMTKARRMLKPDEMMLLEMTQVCGAELDKRVDDEYEQLLTDYRSVLDRVARHAHKFNAITASANGSVH